MGTIEDEEIEAVLVGAPVALALAEAAAEIAFSVPVADAVAEAEAGEVEVRARLVGCASRLGMVRVSMVE